MAATSPLVRLRRLALPLALVALCAAAAHGQTVTSAFLTASTTITATLSNSTGSSSDCRSAFSYLDLNNGTKASPFANCTANGTSTVVLTLASAGTYAAGDQLNIKVNQTTLNTTAGAAFIPAAVAVAVPPVIGAATLTASRTLVVKLPLSSNTVPDNFATNMTVCGGAVELRAAGASAAKAAPFEACSLAADVLTLTLKSAGTYAPGDTVNVVSGQSILKFGSTAYAPLASGSVVRPTLTSVSLSSTSTILIGTSGPASLPGNATAAVCNAVFDIALKNGTILPGALSACSVGPGVTAITATLASGTSYSDGMTVTLKANQTALKAGDQSAAAPLFLPPTSALAIAPTILSASLTAADTITVVLPVASTLDTSACNSAFELRAAGSATAKSSPFSACSLTVNNTQAVLTLASASTYTAGDILNVKSGNDKLLAGSTAYVPQSVTVLPTITSATLVSSTVVRVALPVVSSIPTPYSADDCARSIIVAASNSTAAKGITACALSTDKKALLVTLAAAYAPGDTVNVRTGQWQLRAGASVTLGPNYIAGAAPVAILPGLASATLTSATQVVVTLPAASNVPATFSASDCNAAVDLVSAAGASKDTPFAACALGSGNTTLILNLTASAYAIGDTVSVKAAQTTLKVGNVSYTPYSVAITAILLPTTTAVLVSETSIAVALPTGFNSYLPSNLNASDCNAAFVLVSAAGNAKTAPYTSCSVSGTALTLGIAAGTYAAGDSVNVKANNTLFLGSSSSGPAYVPAANGTQIRPTIVAASLVSTTNVFVALSAAASTSAFNGTLCNDALEVTGGSATVFQNCTLTSDGKGINLVLATASSVSTSNTINVKASQTMLKAAGSDAASSPAFARLTTPITINEAKLAGAFLTAANTITAKLSVVADASSAFSSSCTTVFVMAMSNGTARSNPFSSCSLASDGVTVTLVVGTYASGDTLNIKSDQGLLKVFNQGNGPNYPTLSAATTISPAISTAVATSSSTFTVPLPVASNLVAGNCPSVVEVLPAAGSPSKTVTACSLTTNDTVLTVTISGTGAAGTVDAPFAFGDTLNIKSSNAFLKGLSSTGTDYKPVTGVTITVSPSVGSTLVTGSNTVTVTIPGTTTSVPSPITADACNSALSIFPAASSSARSSPFSACTVGASSLTLTLGSTYVAGDRINVKSSQTVLSMTSGTTVLNYMPLPTASTLLPTLVSAKATSATTIVAVLPVTSTFLKTDTLQASLTQSDCDTVLRVVSSSSVQRNLVATGAACDLNSTSNPGALKVTFAGTDSYAPGDKIDIVSASQSLFLAGTGKTGPAYYPRQITIDPAYVLSVMATAADTISVKLPVSSSVYDGSTSISSPLTPAQCSAILEVKGGSNTRGINSCSINADVLTVKLLGNGTDVYTAGDTFNFKDTNVLLRAGGSPSSLAYKALLTAFVINPVFASAAATKTDVIVVTLPTAINTFVDGTSPVTQLDQTKYGNVITFTPSRTIKTATDACVLSGNTLTIKLVGTSTDVFTAGDVINIASAGQSSLRAGSAATGPVYTAWTSDIKIGAAYLTSAKATADNTIVVTLPVNGVFGDGTSAVTVNSKAQCDSIVEVLAGGSASAPRTLDSSTICTVSGTTLTVYLASTNRFAADDTVRIKAGNTILRVGANTGAVFSQASAATVIAAGYASAKVTGPNTLIVTLPVASSVWTGTPATNATSTLTVANCNDIIALSNGVIATSCTMTIVDGFPTITATLGSTWAAGNTWNIKSQTILLTGLASTGLPYQSTAATVISPAYLTSVKMASDTSVLVLFPATPTGLGTLNDCKAAVKYYAADGTQKTPTGCSLSSSTVTLTVAAVAAGDYVVIATDLVGLSGSAGIYWKTVLFVAAPSYLAAAYAVATNKVMIALPVTSYLAASPTCATVVQVASSSETGCTGLALDATGRFLTITLAVATTVATSDAVKIRASQQFLRVGNSTGPLYYDTTTAVTVPAAYAPYATVVDTQVAEIKLPTTSFLSGNTLSICSSIITGITLAEVSGVACRLTSSSSSTSNDVLVINLASAWTNGATLTISGTQTALTAGSASGPTIGVASSLKIQPGILTAVITSVDGSGNPTVTVTLPGGTTLYDGTPTCSGTGSPSPTCTGSATATCYSGSAGCSTAGQTLTCDKAAPASTCTTPSLTACSGGSVAACFSTTSTWAWSTGPTDCTAASSVGPLGPCGTDKAAKCILGGTLTTCSAASNTVANLCPPNYKAFCYSTSAAPTCTSGAPSCDYICVPTCQATTGAASDFSCPVGSVAKCSGTGTPSCSGLSVGAWPTCTNGKFYCSYDNGSGSDIVPTCTQPSPSCTANVGASYSPTCVVSTTLAASGTSFTCTSAGFTTLTCGSDTPTCRATAAAAGICPSDSTPDCTVVFTSTRAISSCSLTDNTASMSVTMSAAYQPGDKIAIAAGQLTTKTLATYLQAGTTSSNRQTYSYKPTGDLAITPSIIDAWLTGPQTITVKLPVISSVASSAWSCSAVFGLYNSGGSLKASSFSACELSSDRKTVILTLTSASTYATKDTINIISGQTVLVAESSTAANRVRYGPRPTALTIKPALVSAVLTAADTVVVQLPTASSRLNSGNTALETSWACTASELVLKVGSTSKAAKTGTSPYACVISGNTLTYTLNAALVAGDLDGTNGVISIGIVSGQASTLAMRAGSNSPVDTATPFYAESGTVTVYNMIVTSSQQPSSMVSATAISDTLAEVKLPTVATIAASTACSAYLTSSNTASSCSLDATGQILTVTLGSAYAPANTVQIASQTAMTYATSSSTSLAFKPLPSALVISPTAMSAYTFNSKTIAVVLPTASSLYNAGTAATQFVKADCDKIVTVADYDGTAVTLLNDGSADVCALANGGTTLTVKLDAAMNAGATVNIAALNVAAATTKNLIAGSSSGPKYIVRRTPLTISPRVVSANAISATKIEVVLPVASAFVDSGNNVIDLTKANMTTDQCNTIVTIAGKSLSPVLPCSVSGTVLTVNLATSVAPGDAINIAAGNTILRASSPTTGLVYGATGVAYAASSSAVKITLGYFSAVATDQQYIAVTLPYTAKLFNLPTVSSGAELSSSPTQSNCDSILKILSTASGNTARALAASSSCTIAGTLVTLKLAGSGTDYYAVGDRVDVGPGASTADAMLRGDTAAASVTTTSTAYYQSSSLPTSGVTTILPSFSTAAATSPTTIALKLAVRGYLGTAGIFNGSDCASLVTFTPAKTLATTDACSVSTSSPYVLTMKLAGDGTAAGSFAGGDKVNINNAVAGQTTSLVTSLTSGIQFAAAPAAVTIDPNLASVTAIATNKLEIALSAPSYVGGGTLTVAQCTAALLLSSRSPSGDTPCVLDTAKTKLIVTLDAAYADGETVNVQSQTASTATALRAGTDASGPVYVASASALAVKPTFVSATAKAAQSIEVALPVASSFYSGSSAVSPATLTATECAQVLFVKRADGTARGLSACALDATGLILTVTLASNETFAAGDKINVAASNAATSNGASKPLQAQNTGGGQKFVVRSADVVIAPGYVVAAYAVGPATISVALPVTSFIAANADCSTVVDIRQTGATSAKALAATGACSILSDSTGYYLIVNLDGTGANVFASGDKFTIKANNAALLGGTDSTGKAYAATTAVQVNANIDDAILTGPTTVLVPMAAVTTVSLASKADCDAVFVLYSAGGANRTSPSPISSCSLSTDGLAITLTLSADSYQPGDSINIRKDQTAAKVGVVGGSSGTNLVPYPSAITISPRAFGAAATLVAPTSVALSLPAVSSLPATTAASDCNNAVRYTDVSGTDAVNPFTSCAITSDTKAIALNTASPIYKAGDLMNIKSTNNALRWGPQASGAAYYPAASDVPVFATVATATLVDPSTVVLSLPAVSAVPDNFTVPDCLRAIEFKTSAGVAKNGTVASCSLLPDRLGLQVKLLAAANFSAGDTVNIKPQQAELRVSALATGPSYVPKLAAQVVNPALFANANLTSATAITVRLPFASALAAGSDCKTVLALLGAGGVAKNVSSCTLGADGVTLAVTIPAASFVGGDVLNIVPGQKALTLADGTTAYVPSMAGVLVTPNIVSAALTNATIISVTLPTASVLTGTAAADCNAAVVITSNGSAVASPLSACAVSTDGLTLTLTAAATYKPSTGDMVDVAVNQTVLRAGSATGPAYVPRPSPALITVPSPPPSPPPSPAPSPPPSPPLSTANYSARGLATGPLSCNVLIGADTVTTTSGNFTGLPSYAGKKASFRVSCKDAVTGAVYTDDTVASTLPAGLTGLILSPVTALASASVSDIKSVADLANTNKDYLRLLGVPVNASAYGSATNLLAYDYYVKGYVALETPAVAVLNVEGMVAANLLMYTKFFDGLNASVAGRDISAAEALAAAQYVMAMGLKMATAPLNTSSPSAILDLLNATYSILTDKNTTAGGRRLMQGSAVSFTQLQAQAAALAAAAADSNALVTVQQQKLIAAINAGTSISAADLTNIITEASKVIVTQSTVIASAATGLGSGAISPASFTSSYTGSALTTLVAQQQLAAPPGTDVTDTPSPPSDSDDKKSNTGLIVGLVVGLVGGAIVITLIVVFIVMRRRKQNVAAAGQAAA